MPVVERKKRAEERPDWSVWFIIWTAVRRIVLVLNRHVVIHATAEDRGRHKGSRVVSGDCVIVP